MNRTQQRTNVLISVVTVLAIAFMVNYLASRHYARFDWTASGMYTLSPKTEAVVDTLDAPLKIYVLWSRTDPLYPHVIEVLKRYQSLSGHLSVETLDPDINPDQLAIVSQKYGRVRTDAEGRSGLETGLILVYGDNARFIASSDFEDFSGLMFADPHGGDPPPSAFKAETELTSAIAGLLDDKERLVCFTQGHGEWGLEPSASQNLSHLKRSLQLDGFSVIAIDIDAAARIPDTCSLVVVAGPSRPFLPEEASILTDWFHRGRSLLLLLDPVPRQSDIEVTGLEKLAFDAGISLSSDIVLETDPRRLVSQSPVTFTASTFFRHAAVRPLAGAVPPPVVFSSARSLQVVESAHAVAEPLVQTSPMSWGETDIASLQDADEAPVQDAADHDGPLHLAVVSTRHSDTPEQAGRLIVVGDSDFLSEPLMRNGALFNQDFWNALVGWLGDARTLMAIAPKNPEQVHLTLSQRDSRNLLTSLGLQILLIAALGAFIVFGRRK